MAGRNTIFDVIVCKNRTQEKPYSVMLTLHGLAWLIVEHLGTEKEAESICTVISRMCRSPHRPKEFLDIGEKLGLTLRLMAKEVMELSDDAVRK